MAFLNRINLRFVHVADATELAARDKIVNDNQARHPLLLFQETNNISRIRFYALCTPVLAQFPVCRIGFADAYRGLVSAPTLVYDAPGDYEDGSLIGDLGRKRIDLETVFGIFTTKEGI